MAKREVLRQYFGHSSFRPGQEALIDGILAGRDALGIMPTGGGKSLCYQVPALLLPGLTLVVSPLISLMKDQVAALNGVGIPAAFLNSALDAQAFQAVCREIRQGMHKLIYVAPERLLQEVPQKSGEWYFLMGSVAYRRGWLDEAKRYYETAVQMDPGNPEYQQALAMAEGRSAGYRPAGYSRVTTGGCDDPCTRLCGTMLCCNLLGGGGYFCCI